MDINNNQQTNTFTKGMNTDTADMYIPSDQYRYAENLRYVTDVDNNTGELSTIQSGKHLVLLKINTGSEPAEDDDPQGGEQGGEEPQPQEQTWEINGDGRVIWLGESEVSLEWGEGYVVHEYEIISATWYDSLTPPDHVDTPENIKSISIQICPDVGPSYWFVDGVRYDERVPNATIVYVTMQNDGLGLKFSLNAPLMGIFNKVNTIWPITIKYHVKGIKVNPSEGRSDVPAISTEQKFDKIYATTTIRNYGVIVCKLQGESGWSIVRYDKNTNSLYRVFGPCEDELGEDVSIVTRWESDNNIKAYIADGVHELISLNIDDAHIGEVYTSMKDLTGYADVPLPQITVTESAGGHLKPAVVQYAYLLYADGGRQTLVSPLSKAHSLYKNDLQGYYNQTTNKSMQLSLSGVSSDKLNNIKVYRITYVQNGQVPTVDLICDQRFSGDFSHLDLGDSITEITLADFLAETDLKIKPLLIESKNDYLFAANVQYIQDDVDKQFENVDATDFQISIINKEYTMSNTGQITSDKDNYSRSLQLGEWYRYGVVLYDLLGRKSSVKWIGDIQCIGDQYVTVNNTDSYTFKTFGVEITPPSGIENCSGYEIVRCKRGVNDSTTLFTGIAGITYDRTVDDDEGYSEYIMPYPFYTYQNMEGATSEYLTFSCPEYAYQKDDVESILNDQNNLYLTADDRYNVQYSTYFDSFEPFNVYYAIPGNINTAAAIRYQNNTPVVLPYIGSYAIDDDILWGLTNTHPEKIDDVSIYPAFLSPSQNIFQNQNDRKNYRGTKSKIDAVYYSDSPAYNTFNNEARVTMLDSTIPVGGKNFVNWYIDERGSSINVEMSTSLEQVQGDSAKVALTSSGGRCMVLKMGNNSNYKIKNYESGDGFVPIMIERIQHTSTPYGGVTEQSKKYSTYYSFGDYFEYSSSNPTSVDVYNGDVFGGMFIYNAAHAFHTDRAVVPQCPVVYSVPVQTSIDLRAVCGDLYPQMSVARKFLFQDEPVQYWGYSQSNPAYLYNTVYNMIPNIMSYSYVEKTDIDTNKYDTRIHYAGPKTNGESIDSWVKFKAADFLDVDTRYGELTHIRLFKDALMYWQRNATGVLSVNERTILQDVNDTNIVLGTGDVLQRYDYLTTEYGMKPAHHSETQSNTTLYWWDGYKREIVGYSGGQTVQPLNKVKTVSNYINENSDIDKPAFEYDYKYNEVLMNVVDRGTLVYNEFTQAFTSIYTIDFDHSMRFSDELILEANNMFDVWNYGDYNLKPQLRYVVNNNPQMVKTYDNCVFGLGEKWHTYTGGSTVTVDNEWRHKPDDKLNALKFQFFTKGQNSSIDGTKKDSFITSREYDYRFAIPRYDDAEYGNRMRGKVMRVWMSLLDDNSYYKDFSIQYITTKYRISLS